MSSRTDWIVTCPEPVEGSDTGNQRPSRSLCSMTLFPTSLLQSFDGQVVGSALIRHSSQ